jgi:predicted flap endonuclease-1-like 5' DNA nuclease
MFDLNPLSNPDALWQHIIMVVVAIALGFMIGLVYGKEKVSALTVILSKLDKDLAACQKQISRIQKEEISVPVESPVIENFVQQTDKVDDLKMIEGIGAKIELLLNDKGIFTFAQLRDQKPEGLIQLLHDSGTTFNLHDPNTWPRQAELAAAGKWEELRSWQNTLNKGRID